MREDGRGSLPRKERKHEKLGWLQKEKMGSFQFRGRRGGGLKEGIQRNKAMKGSKDEEFS